MFSSTDVIVSASCLSPLNGSDPIFARTKLPLSNSHPGYCSAIAFTISSVYLFN